VPLQKSAKISDGSGIGILCIGRSVVALTFTTHKKHLYISLCIIWCMYVCV